MSTTTSAPYAARLGGWLGHVADTIAAAPGHVRPRAFASRRRRTVVADDPDVIVAVLYPLLNTFFLAGFSRNVFSLPLPDDTVVTFMMIFGIMAIGLNIVAGFAGLLDLGYVAFYALGAYTAAFFASPHFGSVSWVLFSNVTAGFPGIHMPFWIILPVAVLVAATFGALLGAPTLRLRGDYLAIVTLGFGEIVPIFFKNLAAITFSLSIGGLTLIKLENINLTGGPLGINPIDPFVIFGIKFGATSGRGRAVLRDGPRGDRDRRRPKPRALADGTGLGGDPRGRDGGRDDGRQHGPDEAPGVRPGRELRRSGRRAAGVLPRRLDVGLLHVHRPRSSS